MPITQLSPNGVMGRRYSFAAKGDAVALIQGTFAAASYTAGATQQDTYLAGSSAVDGWLAGAIAVNPKES